MEDGWDGDGGMSGEWVVVGGGRGGGGGSSMETVGVPWRNGSKAGPGHLYNFLRLIFVFFVIYLSYSLHQYWEHITRQWN